MITNSESPILNPMKGNPRIRSTFLLDNFYKHSNQVSASTNNVQIQYSTVEQDMISRKLKIPQKSLKVLQNFTNRGKPTLFDSQAIYQSAMGAAKDKKGASRNSINELSKVGLLLSNRSRVGRDSQLSFHSHNSSVSNLSFRSMNSPVKAMRESFDIESIRRQADKNIRKL